MCSFIFIRPGQNWESLQVFFYLCPIDLFCMYLSLVSLAKCLFHELVYTTIYSINIDFEHQCS
jgi:hypothetical protein